MENFFNNSLFLNKKTKVGYIDKLELMVEFIRVIESPEAKEKENFDKFKQWLSGQIKRDLKETELMALLNGMLKYIQSEPETKQRMEVMQYLFEAEFLGV